MAVCPKCSQEMFIQGGKMVCLCGYQYNLPERIPTYNELMEFIREMDYEKELEAWLEVKSDPL